MIYPYVFQAVSLSSGLPLKFSAHFPAILTFSANFFLPCLMSPSYLMKGTNRVAPQYAVPWVLYSKDVIRSQDKLPYLMSQLENRRQSFTRIHFSQNLAFKMTFTFIITKYLTVRVQCWIYVPPSLTFEDCIFPHGVNLWCMACIIKNYYFLKEHEAASIYSAGGVPSLWGRNRIPV
jgi:hypothetical protein